MAFAVNEAIEFRTLVKIFVYAFCYALFAMAVSRELIIPYMLPSMDGYISGDPQLYRELALSKVSDIQDMGIQAFELRPGGQGPAGVASLLYLAWENSYSVVLLNAALHGTSVVFMSLILLQWFPLRTTIIATLPLAISPYMMVWFSQPNKDTFALTGTLLFTYGLMRLIKMGGGLHGRLYSLLIILSGIILMWIVRPYLNQILLPVSVVTLAVFLWVFFKRPGVKNKDVIVFAVCGMVVLIFLGLMGKGAASDGTIDSFRNFKVSNQFLANKCFTTIDDENWQNASFFPSYINDKLKGLMGQRCLMLMLLEVDANVTIQASFVDISNFPAGALEALMYLPRAALLGIFAPWPNLWGYIFNHFSVFYLITSIEAAILYSGLIGLMGWLLHSRAWSALTPIFFSVAVMTVYAMATPFIGALYRYRYPWWMLLICMCIAAWLTLASKDLPCKWGNILKNFLKARVWMFWG